MQFGDSETLVNVSHCIEEEVHLLFMVCKTSEIAQHRPDTAFPLRNHIPETTLDEVESGIIGNDYSKQLSKGI